MILEKQAEPGKAYAVAFTLLVHVALAAVLFLGVQWKRSHPEVVEVELWAPTTRQATYVPPPPPPPEPVEAPQPKPAPKPEPKPEPKVEAPKKPDIAIKDEKKKPEPRKPEPKPEPPKPEPRPEPKKPEPKKTEAPKFDFSKELANETSQLKSAARNSASTQQMANAAAAEVEQRAASNRKAANDYANKIRLQIRSNIAYLPSIQGNPEAIFEVSQLPTREILSVKLKRSSGNPVLDETIARAIRKSSPLPAPDDPSLFQRDLIIKYKPYEE